MFQLIVSPLVATKFLEIPENGRLLKIAERLERSVAILADLCAAPHKSAYVEFPVMLS
jgi:hypothetical protein